MKRVLRCGRIVVLAILVAILSGGCSSSSSTSEANLTLPTTLDLEAFLNTLEADLGDGTFHDGIASNTQAAAAIVDLVDDFLTVMNEVSIPAGGTQIAAGTSAPRP